MASSSSFHANISDDNEWKVVGSSRKKQQTRTAVNYEKKSAENVEKPNDYEARHDQRQFDWTKDETILKWNVPDEIADALVQHFPLLLTSPEGPIGRWSFMRTLEDSLWYMQDSLGPQHLQYNLLNIENSDFFKSMFRILTQKFGLQLSFYPEKYIAEWFFWQRYALVGSVIMMRPIKDTWEVLMLKTFNKHLREKVLVFPCGKAKIGEDTLWKSVVRQVEEELNFKFQVDDQHRVDMAMDGPRAISFVIPFNHDDRRFSEMRLQVTYAEEFVWVPISIDRKKIKVCSYRNMNEKRNDKNHVYQHNMSWEVYSHFALLQEEFDNVSPLSDAVFDAMKLDPRCLETLDKRYKSRKNKNIGDTVVKIR